MRALTVRRGRETGRLRAPPPIRSRRQRREEGREGLREGGRKGEARGGRWARGRGRGEAWARVPPLIFDEIFLKFVDRQERRRWGGGRGGRESRSDLSSAALLLFDAGPQRPASAASTSAPPGSEAPRAAQVLSRCRSRRDPGGGRGEGEERIRTGARPWVLTKNARSRDEGPHSGGGTRVSRPTAPCGRAKGAGRPTRWLSLSGREDPFPTWRPGAAATPPPRAPARDAGSPRGPDPSRRRHSPLAWRAPPGH